MARLRKLSAAWAAIVIAALFTPSGGAHGSPADTAPAVVTPIVRQAAAFGETPRLRRLHVDPDEASRTAHPARPTRDRPARPDAPGSRAPDGALVTATGPAALTGPATSFDGLDSTDGGGIYPPDSNIAVGPHHVVEMVNAALRVWDKAGAPLTGPTKPSDLFSSLPAGNLCRTHNDGDPQVLYDQLADRWLISQFAFVSEFSPPYHQCVAVSRSGDPTGGYYAYDFVMPGNNFNDYAKFGVWPDGYYMTDQQFVNGSSWGGDGAFAFDRFKLLTGDPTAAYLYFNLAGHAEVRGMLPSDLEGRPPAVGTPNTFASFTATEKGDPADALETWAFHADFASPASSTFTPTSTVAVAPFDPIDTNDVPQPGTTVGLDVLSDRLMQHLQYRVVGGIAHLTTNHTVNVSGSPDPAAFRAGVRVEELTSSGSGWVVKNSMSFAPDATNRWMGSAALDRQGNLAVGYSVSSSSTFPSIRYTGRAAGAPANTLGAEQTIFNGSGSQTADESRWGDYTGMVVDPSDNCTFWYVNEYYPTTASIGWHTRIAKFKFSQCTAAQTVQAITGTVTGASTSAPVAGAMVRTTNGYAAVTDAAGHYTLPTTAGTYALRAGAPGYLTTTRTGVTAPSTQDFILTPGRHHSVSGTVTQGGGPAQGSTVTIGTLTTTTDAAGHYAFPVVPVGQQTVEATALDLCHDDASRTVGVNVDKTVDLVLPARKDGFGHTCQVVSAPYLQGTTVFPLTGDDNDTSVALPFAFSFYGTSYSTANVDTNGYLSFATTSSRGSNTALPNAVEPNGAVYAFWDDLYVDSPTAQILTRTLGTAPNRSFVVEWRNVRLYSDATKRMDVEVVLKESGQLDLRYRHLDPALPLEQGSGATVGIENATGDDALQYSVDAATLSDAATIRFIP
ncbi:carboxypeptidase regulatory-like domain-containing protein [Nocardioides sp. MH1]|uniref:carboxypeptidase regulatory-like domain-containing protein n=1 Tax=Nocardioides sp. MH1 TaxID=3242490 RepID=UPI003522E81B